jgi:GTP-binding protein
MPSPRAKPAAYPPRAAPAADPQVAERERVALGWLHTAHFLTSAPQLEHLPPVDLPEIAFVGRSNAGKSTAINTLTQQTRLAFASKTPGRTQHINLFGIGKQKVDDAVLADLPGYGYAAVPREAKLRWQRVMGNYLMTRESLRGVVLMCDPRHGLTELDEILLDVIRPRVEQGLKFLVLLTKSDKLTRSEAAKVLSITRLNAGGGEVKLFSALKKQGVGEAAELLWRWVHPEDGAAPRAAPEALNHPKRRSRRESQPGCNGRPACIVHYQKNSDSQPKETRSMIETFQRSLPNGTTLSCRAAGKPGQPLMLFLHGFPEGAFIWDELLEHFAQPAHGGYRCVAPNLRGFESSSAPPDVADYRPHLLVQDIRQLAASESADGTMAPLVAHDWGGAFGWGLCQHLPPHLRHLVIINSPHPGTFTRELRENPAQQQASAYMHFLARPGRAGPARRRRLQAECGPSSADGCRAPIASAG